MYAPHESNIHPISSTPQSLYISVHLVQSVVFLSSGCKSQHERLLGHLPTPVGFCVIYTGVAPEQTGRLFFCFMDCRDQFVFSSPFLFCRCRAEIVIEHIDRSAVGSIDR